MTLPGFDYVEARSVREACRLLAAAPAGSEPLAGGTELLMALRHRTRRVARVVDLAGVPGLDALADAPDGGLAIGARVTLARLAEDPRVGRDYPVLAESARTVGSPQLQAMGTVAGNLCQDTCCVFLDRSEEQRQSLVPCHKLHGDVCHVVGTSEECWATYSGDLAPALLVLGARIVIADPAGDAVRPLPQLFSGEGTRPLALRAGQIITRIDVPPRRPRSGAVYLKLRQRGSLDYPLLGVAAALALDEEGRCAQASLALTGIERGPVVVEAAERLNGALPTEAAFAEVADAAAGQGRPVKNVWGYPVSYRRRMVVPYVTRALSAALKRATAAGENGG